jgi:hypothetical protein
MPMWSGRSKTFLRMRLNNKFWLFAVVCMAFTTAIAVTLAMLFWRQLNPPEQLNC